MDQDRHQGEAQNRAAQATFGRPSMRTPASSSSHDMSNAPAMRMDAPQFPNPFPFPRYPTPSDAQQWPIQPLNSPHQDLSQAHQGREPASTPGFRNEYDPTSRSGFIPGSSMDATGMNPYLSPFALTEAQILALSRSGFNLPSSVQAFQPHMGHNNRGATRESHLGMGSHSDWVYGGERSQPLHGSEGYPQQQPGLGSGGVGRLEEFSSFTDVPNRLGPRQPAHPPAPWANFEQSRAQNNTPVSRDTATEQDGSRDASTYDENLRRSVRDMSLSANPAQSSNIDTSTDRMLEAASAPSTSTAEQQGAVTNPLPDPNQLLQGGNFLWASLSPDQQISLLTFIQHQGGSPPLNGPLSYKPLRLSGDEVPQMLDAQTRVATPYQNNLESHRGSMSHRETLPEAPSTPQTPDIVKPFSEPTPPPPAGPPPFAPRVPAEYVEAAKQQFGIGAKRLADIAEKEAQAVELQEENTATGKPAPGHQQMKVKTDGRAIFVRKADLFISFHHVRPVKNEKVDRMVHAAPKISKTDLDVIPVANYPDAFPPGTRGFFVPMVAKSALRIKFEPRFKKARNPYMIRIYAGATNIISGKVDFGKSDTREQDYIVVPPQEHIDGFAVTNEIAEQFLTPKGNKNVLQNGDMNDVEVKREDDELPVLSSLRFEITPFEFEHYADFFVRATGRLDRQMMIPVHEKEPVEFPGRIQRYFDIDASYIKWTYNGRKFRDDWSVNEIGIRPDPANMKVDTIDIVASKPSETFPVDEAKLSEVASGSLRKHDQYHQDYRYFVKPLQEDPLDDLEPDRLRVPTTAFARGGLLEQVIAYDPYPNLWNPARTTCFEVHIVSENHWLEITSTREAVPPERRPLDPELVPCERDEIDIYEDLSPEEERMLDDPIERFEVRDLSGPWSEFTGVRSHLPKPPPMQP